ncbi:MAG TPA: aromatic ring-hydroxylating dioxygenase subunit alpha [Acidimicrobiales bacterium]|jgi:Rieske 2Fe-2S family protein|nr:aromatic ring-hydroxylating dioxygenase subunit alpha [Acidimicrobiales bacterium]
MRSEFGVQGTALRPEEGLTYGGIGGGFPLAEWYTSPDAFELERTRLFTHSWALVGTSDEVAETGSYLTADIGGSPLLVMRGPDGVLRAFQNLCRHRGVVLVEGRGRLDGSVVCPYHSWAYDLSGSLDRIPQSRAQFPDVDPTCWGLLPASVGEWQGMVFASPQPDIGTIADRLGDLGKRLEPYLAGDHTELAVARYTVACNWKLIVENHIDVYHLWYLHKETLSAFNHPAFQYEQLEMNWWSEEMLRDPSHPPKGLPWLTHEQSASIGAHLLFPNLMLVTTGNYFATYDAVPLDAGHTELTLRVRACPGADGEALVGQVRSFLSEDVEVCTRMQRAVASPAFSVGPLAKTHEAPMLAFHHHLRQVMGLDEASGAG